MVLDFSNDFKNYTHEPDLFGWGLFSNKTNKLPYNWMFFLKHPVKNCNPDHIFGKKQSGPRFGTRIPHPPLSPFFYQGSFGRGYPRRAPSQGFCAPLRTQQILPSQLWTYIFVGLTMSRPSDSVVSCLERLVMWSASVSRPGFKLGPAPAGLPIQ
jgi:hypothetical protein